MLRFHSSSRVGRAGVAGVAAAISLAAVVVGSGSAGAGVSAISFDQPGPYGQSCLYKISATLNNSSDPGVVFKDGGMPIAGAMSRSGNTVTVQWTPVMPGERTISAEVVGSSPVSRTVKVVPALFTGTSCIKH